MQRKNVTTKKEKNGKTVDLLKQRLADIPSVHKPTLDSDHMAVMSEFLRESRSYNSFFLHYQQNNPYPVISQNYSIFECTCKCSELPKCWKLPDSYPDRCYSNDYHYRNEDSEPANSSATSANSWLIGGTLGSRHSMLIFRSSALANINHDHIRNKPAFKLHITYKVSQAETKLLSKLLDSHGVSEVTLDSDDFNLLWTGNHPKPGVFRSLNTHQRINHFPRSYELTRKDKLYKNIEKMQHSKGVKNFDFIPQTFIMPGDFKELCSVHYRLRGPWIVKPAASSRGRGIFIVETPYQVPLDEPVVVAKYISNPLLVDGHKCDLRLYVAVTSYDPLLIYIYEEGLVRFATVKYDTSHKQLWNPCMHLCNYSINKYHSDYIKSDDPCAENVGHKWTLSALLRHLKAHGKDTLQLMSQIEDIVVKAIITSANSIVLACQMFVPNQSNCFELFGFDILIDEELKPWLLEVNLSPSLGCDSPLDVRLKSAMLADLLTLVGIPAVDPVLKPVHNSSPCKSSSMMKMRLGAYRRVHSADGLSNAVKKPNPVGQNRFTNSTFCLSAEENRLLKLVKSQFERRGGWVRIFPTADSWVKYSQYLDPNSGIPSSALPSSLTSLVVPHNYNHLLHSHLFPYAPKITSTLKSVNYKLVNTTSVVQAVGQRHNRYERKLDSGHRSISLDQSQGSSKKGECKKTQGGAQNEEGRMQICTMLQNGKILTQGEVRRTFSQYLTFILRRLSTYHQTDHESHVEVVLNFLQKASHYLRTPFIVKIPSSKLAGKDRAAIVAKQLNDFLYLYNRETELYSDTVDRLNSVPYKLFSKFLQTAKESDLEEVLTIQTLRNLPQRVNNTNCGFQGLLRCLPNSTMNSVKAATNRNAKKPNLKAARTTS